MSSRHPPSTRILKLLIALAAFAVVACLTYTAGAALGAFPEMGASLVAMAVAGGLLVWSVLILLLGMLRNQQDSTFLERPTEISTLAFPPESKITLQRPGLFRVK